MTTKPTQVSQEDIGNYQIQGAMSEDVLSERENRVASYAQQQVEMHPDDAGDGPTQAIGLGAFLPDMVNNKEVQSILSDPNVTMSIGENAQDSLDNPAAREVAIKGAPTLRQPKARKVGRPQQQYRTPPSREGKQAPRQQALPPLPEDYSDAEGPEDQTPAIATPVAAAQTTVVQTEFKHRNIPIPENATLEWLVWENARKQKVIDGLLKELGKRPSEISPELEKEAIKVKNSENDPFVTLVQVVMGERASGRRQHLVQVNGSRLSVHGFLIDVDSDKGTFSFNARMEKDLFGQKKDS